VRSGVAAASRRDRIVRTNPVIPDSRDTEQVGIRNAASRPIRPTHTSALSNTSSSEAVTVAGATISGNNRQATLMPTNASVRTVHGNPVAPATNDDAAIPQRSRRSN